jgi:hypothetical protein
MPLFPLTPTKDDTQARREKSESKENQSAARDAMLYIVGLGLGDEHDITVRGLESVRSCAKVYMEAYTSLLSVGLDPSSLANLVRLPSPPTTYLRCG